MRHWPAALLTITAALVATSPAVSAGAPHFPRSLHGTLKGTYIQTGGPQTTVRTWKVTGAVFKFTRASTSGGASIGRYKIVAGRVDFTLTESGSCSFSAHANFPLVKSLGRHVPTPLALQQDSLGKFHTLGSMNPRHPVATTETCHDANGQTTTNKRRLDAPVVFEPGGEPWVPPGKIVQGQYDVKDVATAIKTTQSWTWYLKAG